MNGPGGGGLGVQDMGSLWAGTGVGMINTLGNAADIVDSIRADSRKRLKETASFY
jgi:nitronate monooxygenase